MISKFLLRLSDVIYIDPLKLKGEKENGVPLMLKSLIIQENHYYYRILFFYLSHYKTQLIQYLNREKVQTRREILNNECLE